MPPPTEIAFEGLLFGGVTTTVALVLALILFVVGYQRRLLEQHLQMQQVQKAYQHRMLLAGIQAQEAERSRIGHDLHDEVGSTLATIKLWVGQAARATEAAARHEALLHAQDLLSNMATEIRTLSHNLYPAVLSRFGLWEALHQLADSLTTASPMRVELAFCTEVRLASARELALYRMVQELTTNALRHGAASWLFIEARVVANSLSLTVRDNGRGFDYPLPAPTAGAGLPGIEARANLLQASLHVASAPGQGTCVTVEVPLIPPDSPDSF